MEERTLEVDRPYELARTAAPVWWARGRWPNVFWDNGSLIWVGWESGRVVWRTVRQIGLGALAISGTGDPGQDHGWAVKVLGIQRRMPEFDSPLVKKLARIHRGMKPWAAGSLYEGAVSSIVGQSISIAAAATTERRLCELFNAGVIIGSRRFWPLPRPDQLALSSAESVRKSGVTMKRAQALTEIGRVFTHGDQCDLDGAEFDRARTEKHLLAIPGIGPWTVRSAFLWGVADPDAHPSGDVALLRAVRSHMPEVMTLRDLDVTAAKWTPHRGWAARLFWLDLLGFDGGNDAIVQPLR